MARDLLETLVPSNWDSQKPAPNSGATRVRWLQQLGDLINRPVNNRQTAATSDVALATTGAVQSTGVGVASMLPKRYGEFTVKSRVTYSSEAGSPTYVYVYRTTGQIPAAGEAPNEGDVIVGGDAFTGGPTSAGVIQMGTLSTLDSGLSQNQKYSYYLVVYGQKGDTVSLTRNSQMLVMERS